MLATALATALAGAEELLLMMIAAGGADRAAATGARTDATR